MKKLSIFLALAAVALGFSSCSEDKEPVYQAPTQFVLNTPAMEDQYIDLGEGGTLELVASQPNYGYSAVANYSAQVSLSPDFETFETVTPVNEHLARMTFNQSDIALAMCTLLNIDGEDTYNEMFPNGMPYMTVYFRAVCQLAGVESSLITSNVVKYNNLKGYLAVQTPGYIYMIGDATGGWTEPSESNAASLAAWRLFEPENAIGSKVYMATFENLNLAGGYFRFYTELSGWDGGASLGYIVDDNGTSFPEVTGEDENYEYKLVNGKGSFNFPNWTAGSTVTIVVDLSDPNNMTMTLIPGEATPAVSQYIYLVGSISGWMPPAIEKEADYKDFRLVCSDGSGVYTGSFPVTAGHVNFRFATQLSEAGWDNPFQIGSQAEDADVACTFTNGTYAGSYVSGKGNWAFDIDKDGTLTLVVDTNGNTVSFVFE